MKIAIKNMVCPRCIQAVSFVFKDAGVPIEMIRLGEVTIAPDKLTQNQTMSIKKALENLGFEWIDDARNRQINKIKTLVLNYLDSGFNSNEIKLSVYLSDKLHKDYSTISNSFSESEGMPIEQYVIALKIEKVKELLSYDEKSLSQIAADLGYSSVAHLSTQFKKVTGVTPSAFKNNQIVHRKSIDSI